jgi:hypothetical protein
MVTKEPTSPNHFCFGDAPQERQWTSGSTCPHQRRASSLFRQWTDMRRACRMTCVHLLGASWFSHVSLSCLSTFHLRVRLHVPSRFVTCVLWLFAHVALNSAVTCRRPVLTRGIVTHVHVSLLCFAMCRHLACDTCRFCTFPRVAI